MKIIPKFLALLLVIGLVQSIPASPQYVMSSHNHLMVDTAYLPNSFLQSKAGTLVDGTITIMNTGSGQFLAHNFDFRAEEYEFCVPASESSNSHFWELKAYAEGYTILSNDTQFELGFYGLLFPQGRLDGNYNMWSYGQNEDETYCFIHVITNKKLVVDENGITATASVDCNDESAKFSITYIDSTTEEEDQVFIEEEDATTPNEEEDATVPQEEDAIVPEEDEDGDFSFTSSLYNSQYGVYLANDDQQSLYASPTAIQDLTFIQNTEYTTIQFTDNLRYLSKDPDSFDKAHAYVHFQTKASEFILYRGEIDSQVFYCIQEQKYSKYLSVKSDGTSVEFTSSCEVQGRWTITLTPAEELAIITEEIVIVEEEEEDVINVIEEEDATIPNEEDTIVVEEEEDVLTPEANEFQDISETYTIYNSQQGVYLANGDYYYPYASPIIVQDFTILQDQGHAIIQFTESGKYIMRDPEGVGLRAYTSVDSHYSEFILSKENIDGLEFYCMMNSANSQYLSVSADGTSLEFTDECDTSGRWVITSNGVAAEEDVVAQEGDVVFTAIGAEEFQDSAETYTIYNDYYAGYMANDDHYIVYISSEIILGFTIVQTGGDVTIKFTDYGKYIRRDSDGDFFYAESYAHSTYSQFALSRAEVNGQAFYCIMNKANSKYLSVQSDGVIIEFTSTCEAQGRWIINANGPQEEDVAEEDLALTPIGVSEFQDIAETYSIYNNHFEVYLANNDDDDYPSTSPTNIQDFSVFQGNEYVTIQFTDNGRYLQKGSSVESARAYSIPHPTYSDFTLYKEEVSGQILYCLRNKADNEYLSVSSDGAGIEFTSTWNDQGRWVISANGVVATEEDVTDSFSSEESNYYIKNGYYGRFLKNLGSSPIWGSLEIQPLHIFSSGGGSAKIQFSSTEGQISNEDGAISLTQMDYGTDSDWMMIEVSSGVYCLKHVAKSRYLSMYYSEGYELQFTLSCENAGLWMIGNYYN